MGLHFTTGHGTPNGLHAHSPWCAREVMRCFGDGLALLNWTRYTEQLALRIHGWCASKVMRWNGGRLALGNWTWYTKVAALGIHRRCAKEVMGWIGDGLALGKWTPYIEQLALRAIAVGVQAE